MIFDLLYHTGRYDNLFPKVPDHTEWLVWVHGSPFVEYLFTFGHEVVCTSALGEVEELGRVEQNRQVFACIVPEHESVCDGSGKKENKGSGVQYGMGLYMMKIFAGALARQGEMSAVLR